MVYLPVEIFTNILSFLEDYKKTNQKQKQIKLNRQLVKVATHFSGYRDWKLFLLASTKYTFKKNYIINFYDERYDNEGLIYIQDDDDDEYDDDEEYDSDFFETE